MSSIKMIQLEQKGDERGNLIVVESNDTIPFSIQRAFYMLKTKNDVARGQHANRVSEFVLINIQGSVTIDVDTGHHKQSFVLDTPDQGLYLPSMIWKEMHHFSEDSILLVLSNMPYNEDEYIRSYDLFCQEVQECR